MRVNPTQEKCDAFAMRIIKFYKHLKDEHKEYHISTQILRSGTSIAANYSESQHAASKKDFLNKVYISFKECGETIRWIQFLYAGEYITKAEYTSLFSDATELDNILGSIIISTKKSLDLT